MHNGLLPHAFKFILSFDTKQTYVNIYVCVCMCMYVYIYTYVKPKKLLTSLFKARRGKTMSSETVHQIWQTFPDVAQWPTALYASSTLLRNVGKNEATAQHTATALPSADSGMKRSEEDEYRPKCIGTWSDESRDAGRTLSALRVFMLLLGHSNQMVI